MKIYKTIYFTTLVSLAVWSHADAASQDITFRSETLASAAKVLELAQLDTLQQGTSVVSHGDLQLTMTRNANKIEHIGRRLFAPELRQHNPSPVYDYLEYAWLDHTCKLSDNPFLYQNLKFEDGSWKLLDQVTDSVPFSVTSINGKRYRVEWSLPDGKLIIMTFPIGYERLSMSSRRELENNLIADLQDFDTSKVEIPQHGIDMASMEQMESGIWCEKGETYMIAEINQNRYFTLKKKGIYKPVFDPDYTAESMANLFSWGLLSKPTHGMVLTFKLYENKQQQALVTMDQLLGFFHQRGCKVFWGLEGITDDEIYGTLMVVNEGYGYNHIIGVSCPRQDLFADKCVMKASVSLFVPTSNINNIFYQPEGKKKKIIWQ